MSETTPTTTFLSLPPELRNAIYDLIYTIPSSCHSPKISNSAPIPRQSLTAFGQLSVLDRLPPSKSAHSSALPRTCKQLHTETQLIYLHRTFFRLTGPYATPDYFKRLTSSVPPSTLAQIRNIVITGRINHLNALNESWDNIPFGNPNIDLTTLTIVPRRPQTHEIHYAEVADLHQCHTLAYILGETLKSLKNVQRLIVRNDDDCFNTVVWRLVYRSLVYRLWRWGGGSCGLMFRQDEDEDSWFEVLVRGDEQDGEIWSSAGDEVKRLVGGEKGETGGYGGGSGTGTGA